MDPVFLDPKLTPSDAILLRNLADDIGRHEKRPTANGPVSHATGKPKVHRHQNFPLVPRNRCSDHRGYSPDVNAC